MRKVIYWALLGVVLSLGVIGGFLALGGEDSRQLTFGSDPGLPTLEFHTTGLATTPQIPFWAGVASGEITSLCNIKVTLWKDLDSLRAILLAGKGDLWLGHSEGFAQAALRGAPVTLLVVSGWRKFYFLSRIPGDTSLAALANKEIPFTPAGSPAVPVMRKLESLGAPPMKYQPFEPRRLALALSSGREDRALAPEPLVSRLLQKAPDLKIVASLEDEYGKLTKGPARMPIAGIAVNRNTLKKHPELIKKLVAIICRNARLAAGAPDRGLSNLPQEFEKFISQKEIGPSLQRDLILALPGVEAEKELRRYLSLLLPNGEKDFDALPGEFLWR
jgi:NitT/TauT family transport system substrate-binding protein